MVRRASDSNADRTAEESKPKIDRRLDSFRWAGNGCTGHAAWQPEYRVTHRAKSADRRARSVGCCFSPTALRSERDVRRDRWEYPPTEAERRPPQWKRIH